MTSNTPTLWSRSFLIIICATFASSVAFYLSMPIFPLLLTDFFALEGLTLGIATASYTAAAILTRLPAGVALDMFGRKKILLLSSCLFAFTYILYPLAPNAISITIVRFIHGALWGIMSGANNTVAVDLLPASRRGEGIGYFGLSMLFGMAIGPAFGMFLRNTYGFTILFIVATGLAFMCLALQCCIKFPTVPTQKSHFSFQSLFAQECLFASLAVLIICMAYGTIMNFTASYALTIPGASSGLFFIVLAIGTGITRLFSGRIFDKSGAKNMMFFAYLCIIGGCSILALLPYNIPFIIGGVCIGFGFGIAVPTIQTMVNGLVPAERRGAANATFMTGFDLGIFIGIIVASFLQKHWGWSFTFSIMTAGCMLSGIFFWLVAYPHYTKNKRG